jgi:hypothetical protein
MSVKVVWSEGAKDQKAEVADAHWLLEFAEMDLDRVSDVVHRELAARARSFILGNLAKGGVDGYEGSGTLQEVRAHRELWEGRRPFSLEDLRSFQTALRDGLHALARLDVWTCRGDVTTQITWIPGGRVLLASTGAGDWTTAFTRRTFSTFLAVSGRLRRCRYEECGRWFIAAKRQEFCTPQHGGIVRTRTKRLKEKDQKRSEQLSDKRHDRYAKQVRKKNPKAKVGRYRKWLA